MADAVGDRFINLIGTGILSVSILGTGFSNSGLSIIGSRLFQGLGTSMCFPTGISIVTRSFNPGRRRNIALASLGLAQPLGYLFGLVLEGAFASYPGGWRVGFKACAFVSFLVTFANFLTLPPDLARPGFSWSDISHKVDWIGALSAGAFLGTASYICA